MTGTVIKGINFRKVEALSSVENMLLEMGADLSEAGEDGKKAEIFAVVRFDNGSVDIWTSATLSALTRVGMLEALKHHLLAAEDSET